MKAKTTDQMTPLRDHCLSHFAALRIPIEAAALDELLARAEKESFSHLSFLDRLLGAEAGARRERAVARRIRSGTVTVNGGGGLRADAPFGGYRESGIGRELGRFATEDYTETKTVHMHLGERTDWWLPR